MAKYYNTKINSRYVATVSNDSKKSCSFDEQTYDEYYDEMKAIIKTISANIDKIIKSVKKIEEHPKSGKASITYAKKIIEDGERIKQELTQSRNNLGVKLDAEFKRQIKAWIAWNKQQMTNNKD